jgi:hypothetical protein
VGLYLVIVQNCIFIVGLVKIFLNFSTIFIAQLTSIVSKFYYFFFA